MGRKVARILIDEPWAANLLKGDIVAIINLTTVTVIFSRHAQHSRASTWQVSPKDRSEFNLEFTKLEKALYGV